MNTKKIVKYIRFYIGSNLLIAKTINTKLILKLLDF